MRFDCMGYLKFFNPLTKDLTFQAGFLDDKHYATIEKICGENMLVRLVFSTTKGTNLKTYPQLKRVWEMFTAIVINCKMVPTRENVETIETFCRNNLYPRRSLNTELLERMTDISNRELEEPIHLSEQTVEQMKETMRKIEDTWPEVFHTKEWQSESH